MKFFNKLWTIKGLISSPANSFDKIVGHDDVKDIVRCSLDTEDNYNMIFVGAPASGKTLFLEGIMDIYREKDAVYFDATNMTNNIHDILEEKRPRIICIDEIEKASKKLAGKIAQLLSYDFTIKSGKSRSSGKFSIDG